MWETTCASPKRMRVSVVPESEQMGTVDVVDGGCGGTIEEMGGCWLVAELVVQELCLVL
jgi:hypothetical protein